MSNVFIDFAGIFHVKDDLFRFIDTMEDHQKVLIFTINSENDFKNVLRIETSGIQKLLMQIGIPANMLGFSYIVTALELIALDPDYLTTLQKGYMSMLLKNVRVQPPGSNETFGMQLKLDF